jgi:hypothetical protein
MGELLTFALGLVSAYLAAQWKARRDLEADYDRDLRGARIAAYRELWKLLEPLARYAPPGAVTTATARALASALRHWYFHDGGLFLSGASRDAYFALQQALEAALATSPGVAPAAGETTPDRSVADPAALQRAGSALRTATAADVGTRRASALAAA